MSDGILQAPDDFMMQVGLGLVPGFKLLRKFGDNETISGGTAEDIWPPGTRRVLPTVAGVVSTVSSSGDDDASPADQAGTQVLRIEGLGTDWLEQTEDILMNGATPVLTTKEFIRVNRMYGILSGSAGWNVGNISASIGGALQAYIEAGEGQTHQALYTVPANMSFLITDYEVSVGRMATSGDIHFTGEVRIFGTNTWLQIENTYLTSGQAFGTHRPTVMIPPKTELRAGVLAAQATQASAMFGGLLVETNMLNVM